MNLIHENGGERKEEDDLKSDHRCVGLDSESTLDSGDSESKPKFPNLPLLAVLRWSFLGEIPSQDLHGDCEIRCCPSGASGDATSWRWEEVGFAGL